MNKKIIITMLSLLLLCIAAFSGFAYYLNKPYIVVARSLVNSTLSVDGSSDIKATFDTSKLMQNAEIASNPFALLQIQMIKSTLESSSIKLSYTGAISGSKLKLDGSINLPQILGKSTNFSLYSEEGSTFLKQDEGTWTKSEYAAGSTTAKERKADGKAVLDFLKSCPVTKTGNMITLTMNPKYNDIKNMLPKETLDSINSSLKDGPSLEQIINGLNIQVKLDINKNSRFFIPTPNISKAEMSVNGDLSKLALSDKSMTEETKQIIEGISFSANCTGNFKKAASSIIEKPADIK